MTILTNFKFCGKIKNIVLNYCHRFIYLENNILDLKCLIEWIPLPVLESVIFRVIWPIGNFSLERPSLLLFRFVQAILSSSNNCQISKFQSFQSFNGDKLQSTMLFRFHISHKFTRSEICQNNFYLMKSPLKLSIDFFYKRKS